MELEATARARMTLHPGQGFAFRRGSGTVFVSIIVLYAFVRFWHLGAFCLDGDEITELTEARRSWRELPAALTHDISHPPVADFMLWVWFRMVGESVLGLRLLPALTALAAIAPVVLLARELNFRAGEVNLALALMAVNAYLIYYAQHIRMFSLLLVLSGLSVWQFIRFVRAPSRSSLVKLFCINLVMVHTHYWGWMVVGGELLLTLASPTTDRRSFVVALLAMIACSIPWFAAVFSSLASGAWSFREVAWIGKPSPSDLIDYFTMLNGSLPFRASAILGLALFGLPVVWWTIGAFNSKSRDDESGVCAFLAFFALVPVALTFVGSWLSPQSVWGARHLIIVAIPYYLLVSAAAWRVSASWLRMAIVALMIAWAFASGILAELADNKKFRWDQMAQAIASQENSTAGTITVYTFEEFVDHPLGYYLQKAQRDRFRVNRIDDLSNIVGGRFWIAFRDTTWKGDQQPERFLERHGYEISERQEFAIPRERIAIFRATQK
jgi:hypothetical protein